MLHTSCCVAHAAVFLGRVMPCLLTFKFKLSFASVSPAIDNFTLVVFSSIFTSIIWGNDPIRQILSLAIN